MSDDWLIAAITVLAIAALVVLYARQRRSDERQRQAVQEGVRRMRQERR